MGISAHCGRKIGIQQRMRALPSGSQAIAEAAGYDTLGDGGVSLARFLVIGAPPLALRGHACAGTRDSSKPAARIGTPAHR